MIAKIIIRNLWLINDFSINLIRMAVYRIKLIFMLILRNCQGMSLSNNVTLTTMFIWT